MQPQNIQIEPGAVVLARDGFIGTVEEVLPAQQGGQPTYFVTAPNQNGDRLLIPLNLVDPQSQPGEVYLREVFQNIIPRSINVPAGRNPQEVLSQEALPENRPVGSIDTGFPDQSHLTIPIVEEQLNVGKRTVELGALEIRKTVEQVQDNRRLPLTFDQVDVEHVAINRPLDAPLEPHYEGDVYIIPVMEEVLVIEKRLMLKEEVRIRKRQAVSDQQINETLRREYVEIVPPNLDHVTINDSTKSGSSPVTSAASEDQVNEIIDGDMDPPTSGIPLTDQPTLPNTALGYPPTGYEQPPVSPGNTGRTTPPGESF
ncbi:MAG: YsnF/AvaK domain-containing protein [Chloroflexi bacterium]|nr:YsnF/AvaK domain-containing protein [Chloroflexota bacterium]OJV97575.1 MAG: hypothetical protein BGO39_07360 [Chloroflexi bacterium 54-19]